ncbi:s-methyl-5-thioribose-1-phosphate isomerase [Treponema phagedenis]|uniref:s-methyl-5-thioribose-1-phosphate isomerase n=1 Tax=Treponema phagedenis TaxID=162 RepID=UPI0011EE2968|nr:s-methyl-5-thioribose-1-phosphate isomerase [Treponema phagedenis]TYT79611.1 S-methyl-5-thioribose-1-phosphate isomerase [Treponema phagedenis]
MRQDYNLGFLLQYENVAWYENGAVKILDRRKYPSKVEYVFCADYTEVAQAITDMVTQSGGPFAAAAMGMVLAANNALRFSEEEAIRIMEDAAYTLSHARPTTTKAMQKITNEALSVFKNSISQKKTAKEITDELFQFAIDCNNKRYAENALASSFLADCIPDGSGVLTQCFGETTIGTFLRKINEQKKQLVMYCAETRPYLQGARLTAALCYSQGFDTVIITDNMIAAAMAANKVQVFISAADIITEDGHIINKVGTLQIALIAKHFKIPYYVIGIPDPAHPSIQTTHIEERNPKGILEFNGMRIAVDGVKAWYPAFDITPPELCTAIATDKGLFPPNHVQEYRNT